jgi:type III secretory pathway lipoprotein EscJ
MKQNLKKILLFLILFLTLTSCKDKNLDVSIQEEQSDLNELFTQEQINEIEDSSIQIEPSKNEKLDEIRKKLALK